MTPIPIPTDVATCSHCGGSMEVLRVEKHSTCYASFDVYLRCAALECDGMYEYGEMPKVVAWIIRKLAAPDTKEAEA